MNGQNEKLDWSQRKDRLALLESHATATEARLTTVERTLDTHGAKLDRIVQAVTASGARREFDPAAVLSFVKDAAMLAGIVATSIIYIATNISDKPVSLLQLRQSQIERRLDTMESRGITTIMKGEIK